MIYSVHQPQYLPWLGFFDKVLRSDAFVFLDRVQYKHREFQNRNRIRTKDGWIWLTVPVICSQGELISEVLIDNSKDWRQSHLKSLRSWYGRADYFAEHFPFFESLFSKEWARLIDLNLEIARYVFDILGVRTKIFFESEIGTTQAKTQRIVEIGKKIDGSVYLSGAGGRDYLDLGLMSAEGIKCEFQSYDHPVYRQQFLSPENEFIANLSIVDLLFNEGPRSRQIMRKLDERTQERP